MVSTFQLKTVPSGKPFDSILSGSAWVNDEPLYYYVSQDVVASGDVEKAITKLESYTNLKFIKVSNSDDANLIFQQTSETDLFTPVSDNPPSALIIGVSSKYSQNSVGSSLYADLLNTIGQSLGLKTLQTPEGLPYTVMSQDGQYGRDSNTFYLNTFGPFDIAALQALYGVNNETYLGDTTYYLGGNNADPGIGTIWDAGGIDSIWAADTNPAIIDLRASTLSSGALEDIYLSSVDGYGLIIASQTVIENAYGSSKADTIYGNNADNELYGKDGDDLLRGFGGNDTIDGGNGEDLVVLEEPEGQYKFLYDPNDQSKLILMHDKDFITLTNIERIAFGPVDGKTNKELRDSSDPLATYIEKYFQEERPKESSTNSAPNTSGASVSSISSVPSQSTSSPLPEVFGKTGPKTSFTGTNPDDPIIGDNLANELIPLSSGSFTLEGRGGADDFVFSISEKFTAKNADTIVDFRADEGDRILLSRQAFDGLTAINLRIVKNAKKLRKAARKPSNLIYNKKSGGLYYNSNDVVKGFGDRGGLFAVIENLGDLFESSFAIF